MKIQLMITQWDQEKSEFYEASLGHLDVNGGCIELVVDANTAHDVQSLVDMAKPTLPWYRISQRLWARRFCRNFQHVNTYAVVVDL